MNATASLRPNSSDEPKVAADQKVPTPNRMFASLDIWRALAALWVLTLHVTPIYYTNNPIYRVTELGQLGVCVFFVISGFCIAGAAIRTVNARSSVGSYLFARVRRIYPPYYASCGLVLLSALAMKVLLFAHVVHSSGLAANPLPTSPKYWFATLTLTHPWLREEYLSVVFWSLSYEVAFYFIVGGLMSVVLRLAANPEAALLTSLHLVTVGTLILLNAAPSACPFPLDLWHQFGIGVLLFDWLGGARRPRYFALLVAALVLAYGLRHLDVPKEAQGFGRLSDGLKSLAALCCGAALLFTHRWDSKIAVSPTSKTLMWMGGFSYSIYLFHPTVSTAFERVIRGMGRERSEPFLNFIVVVIACVIASYVLHLIFERPFMRRKVAAPVRTVTTVAGNVIPQPR